MWHYFFLSHYKCVSSILRRFYKQPENIFWRKYLHNGIWADRAHGTEVEYCEEN